MYENRVSNLHSPAFQWEGMCMMNPALIERLLIVAREAEQAGHGGKEAVYQTACKELMMAKSTLLRKIRQVAYKAPRKKRADVGTSALTYEEALKVSAVITTTFRNNGKKMYSLERAVDDLSANGLINAGYLHHDTGEWFPLSIDAVRRALYHYKLHPNQLRGATPCVRLKTEHPNHVWQLDASLCVLYYLKNPGKRGATCDTGLRMMRREEFNPNKPKNLDRIVNDRVWSFELTDHTSGWIYAEYRFGGETTKNFTDVLINAMQERGGADVLHGVPRILYTDPGCALVSATMRNLCRALGIQLISHKAGNARATGSVEKARDILECEFESRLYFVRIEDIDKLNDKVKLWRMEYNATRIHSRHKRTRTDCWKDIAESPLLVKAPSIEVCRQLAVSNPETRKVRANHCISVGDYEYSVKGVPGVFINDTILVTRNPWRNNEVQVVIIGEDGRETFYPAPMVIKNQYGFDVTAPTIGESFKAPPHTPAQKNLAEVERVLYGTQTVAETEAARKAKALPFGGRFNPYLSSEKYQTTSPIDPSNAGLPASVGVTRFEERLNPVAVVQILRERFKAAGKSWHGEFYLTLTQRFPDGIPADQVDALGDELMAQSTDVVVNLASHG
ncbi:transposase family protein [Arsenophonus sp. ENCA]|uniref:integrase catalytic domain-containing protein n=1 Tax=Arsenophonus sp. ENCA TaxID=1987579 RepID=UPI0025BC23B7|nr:transposase family protein [Arsenophonus sp. ENCA]